VTRPTSMSDALRSSPSTDCGGSVSGACGACDVCVCVCVCVCGVCVRGERQGARRRARCKDVRQAASARTQHPAQAPPPRAARQARAHLQRGDRGAGGVLVGEAALGPRLDLLLEEVHGLRLLAADRGGLVAHVVAGRVHLRVRAPSACMCGVRRVLCGGRARVCVGGGGRWRWHTEGVHRCPHDTARTLRGTRVRAHAHASTRVPHHIRTHTHTHTHTHTRTHTHTHSAAP
jgi:hypothetical protein